MTAQLEILIEGAPAPPANATPIVAIAISIFALLFTLGSFWWMNVRKGTISALPSTTFSGYMAERGIGLRVQILLHNSGAREQVVRALRLVGRDSRGITYYLENQTFRKSIMPQKADTEDFAHGFSIAGRTTASKFVHFSTKVLPQLEPGATAKFQVQAMLGRSADWQDLGEIEIHLGIVTGSYIGWSSNPGHWNSDTRENGFKYQRELMEKAYPKAASATSQE